MVHSLRSRFFCLTTASLAIVFFPLSASGHAAGPSKGFWAVAEQMQLSAFSSPIDGRPIKYRVAEAISRAKSPRPLVIVPGRGESYYRYSEMIHGLQEKGYGPVFLIEHRGQGTDTPRAEERGYTDVEDFEHYVVDLTYFLKSVVADRLLDRKINQRPVVISHSMGSAISFLALSQNPELALGLVYIAPMFDINFKFGRINLNPFQDLIPRRLTSLLCLIRTLAHKRLQQTPKSLELTVDSMDTQECSIDVVTEMESRNGIRNLDVTLRWLGQAAQVTQKIRRSIQKSKTPRLPTLMVIAQFDDIVQNGTLNDYVSKQASECRTVVIRAGHSIHNSRSRRSRKQLIETLAEFSDDLFLNCETQMTDGG